ncbi:MAG: hypothetical protein ACTHXA_09995 [Gulosibacter sp.]|uniref:hypothetical protein n=1 Tax=Gulosibacter sp. TaxID=2817531 RepID=UPI003F8D9FC3
MALITTPLILVALVVGIFDDYGELTIAQMVLFPAFGMLFLCGWLFVLSAYTPERFGRWVTRINLVLMPIGVAWLAVGTIWFGIEALQRGTPEPPTPYIMILVGVFLIVAAGLLVFRKLLPWNRGDSLPTGRQYGQRRVASRVRLVNHLGEIREFNLDTSVSQNDLQNSRGKVVASRLAWALAEAGLEDEIEVVPEGVSISSWDLLATELTGSGRITLKLPRAAMRVQELWDAAQPTGR